MSTGVVDPTFVAPTVSGTIRDLELVGNHLFVAGKFTHIGGVAQKALGTLFADTGKRDLLRRGDRGSAQHSRRGDHRCLQISVDPQNTELMAVGNFTTVDGQYRSQIARFDIGEHPERHEHDGAPSLSTWSTLLYTSPCAARFDTYMTDVEYSTRRHATSWSPPRAPTAAPRPATPALRV